MKRMIDDKITSKLSIKNDVLEIDGAINADKITGDEIVENMSGYTCIPATELPDIEIIYCGVCKNGNKLTFAIFANFTTAEGQTSLTARTICSFGIPAAVGAKLYPQLTGDFLNHVTDFKVNLYSAPTTVKEGYAYVYKQSNTNFEFNIACPSLVASTKYQFRIECTFLLSDNLVS